MYYNKTLERLTQESDPVLIFEMCQFIHELIKELIPKE